MGTNKVATVVLMDVSQLMAAMTDNGETFFERSLTCFKRMILRKIFSQDHDDMGVVLFGSNITDNNLTSSASSCYRNIQEFSPLSLPDWNLFERVENLQISTVSDSDWVQGLVVAQDFLKNQSQGRKYRTKQLVMFTNLNSGQSKYANSVEPVIKALESESVQLIVIGNDTKDDCEDTELGSDKSDSLELMFRCIAKLSNAVQFSFGDIEKDLKYYEQKRKMVRFYSVPLIIGSQIQLPVRWMKVNKEPTRFKWEVPPENVSQYGTSSKIMRDQNMMEPTIEFETDTVKRTNFGGTIIDLSYADVEALKRKSGPASLTYLGSVKSERISRSMFVGKDQYIIIADKTARSVAMFSAFVDALLESKKYGIARRVATKNGKIVVGALLPFSDDYGKALYFLKLPYAEYVQNIPMVHLPHSTNLEAIDAINKLIDNAMLPDDLLEEDKGILLRDPTFQSRCHALYLRAIGKLPEMSLVPLPETVKQILNPAPFNEEAKDALKKLAQIFPLSKADENNEESPKVNVYESKAGPKVLSLGNISYPQKNEKIDVHQEVKDIMFIANEEYENVFSEEMM